MANETTITMVGNLTADPELRFLPNGTAMVKITLASTPRILDRASGEWKDGDPLFLNCTAWRDLAEHIAESLTKGTRVIGCGCRGGRTRRPATSGPRTAWTSRRSGRVCASLRRRSPG